MNLICHCTTCGYCEQERCTCPIPVINENGLCDFRYDKRGFLKQFHTDYSEKTKIEIIDVEPIIKESEKE